MKKTIAVAALVSIAGAPLAAVAVEYDDYARVLRVNERIDRYNQPRQECYTDGLTVAAPEAARPGVAGAVIGGLAGALLGSQVGRGDGKVAAAAVGAATGAIAGDRVQNAGAGASQPVQRCHMVDNYVTQVIGYTVKYEYQGRTYTENMNFNPGDTLRMRVSLMPMR